MNEYLSEMSLSDYFENLSSRQNVPGGGSASALAGALGAALGCMAGNISETSVGDADYPQYSSVVQELSSIGSRLIKCVDRDAEVFESFLKVYRLPSDDPQKNTLVEAALREAASVPLEIAELSARAIELLFDVRPYVKPAVISDVAVGAALASAALKGGAINVKTNCISMTDRKCAAQLENRITMLTAAYLPDAERLYREIFTDLK